MRIDSTNYEAYLLDYAEGTLTEAQSAELMAFLEAHPELEIDLNELLNLTLLQDETEFDNKDSLKREEKDLVSDEQFVAYIEGQLSAEEKLFVEKSVANNAALQKELALFQKTILVPEALDYADKESLKRRTVIVWFNPQYAKFAAAASVLLALVLGFLFYSNHAGPAQTAANTEDSAAHRMPVMPTPQPLQVADNKAGMSAATTTTASDPNKNTANANQRVENGAQPGTDEQAPKRQQKNDIKTPALNPLNNAEKPLLAQNSGTVPAPKTNNTPLPEKRINEREQVLVASVDPMDSKVITLADDETEEREEPKKTGFWAKAGKTLSRLNRAGMKTVDGKEKDKQASTDYVLTLGNVNIQHSSSMR